MNQKIVPGIVMLLMVVMVAWGIVLAQDVPSKKAGHPGHYFSFSSERESYDRAEVISAVAITAKHSEGRYSILDETWKPGFAVSSHYHATHSETFYIISGQVEWTVNGEVHVLKAGDAVYIPPRAVHSVRVMGDTNLHTLMIYEPGGYEEHILREKAYTEEQLKDPKILEELRRLNDFNPVKEKKDLP